MTQIYWVYSLILITTGNVWVDIIKCQQCFQEILYIEQFEIEKRWRTSQETK